jgi:hypothetical protein
MSTLSPRRAGAVTENPAVVLYQPEQHQRNVAWWRINGFPAVVEIWTPEQWEELQDRPTNAQFMPCGLWCVLRML